MADFYEIHNGEDFIYKVKKDEINIFIQDYRAILFYKWYKDIKTI